jgi:hypothetical protein
MTSEPSRPTGESADSLPTAPPDEPTDDAGLTDDGSVLDDAPDTTTGKQQLLQEDDRPGPGV